MVTAILTWGFQKFAKMPKRESLLAATPGGFGEMILIAESYGIDVRSISLVHATRVMFTVMLVQLWTNYGDYIENRVFSPTVVAAGTFDREGDVMTYVMEFHKWENNTLHMTLDVPENPLLQIETPYNWAEWGDGCLKVNTVYENVSVVVWSLWSK